MDTVSKLNKNPHFLSFSRKLFLSIIAIYLAFAGCFLAYQYQREKEYKIDSMDLQLQGYNKELYQMLHNLPDSIHWTQAINEYIKRSTIKDLRVTIINPQGNVLYDSYENHKLANHIGRPEVQMAIKEGKGYDVRRTSETTGITYFYSATSYKEYFIRSALPYSVSLTKHLKADQHYLWFTGVISLLLIFIFYKYTSKLGETISQLREFAKRADKNEPVEMESLSSFPHNELGEISQHIIQIYKRLRETKEALYIEREKLITHLQTSREGLGVFNKDKKEILVNNLFIQYSNLISDTNLQITEEIFQISDFQKITDFINKVQSRTATRNYEEKRMSINIEKNGRIFFIECIIFQDLSFEISINNITQEEEQVRLKRQLTQNIAHELKTPVSSIQGYLETIVSNENLPEDKMKTFLERCYAQSNRLSRLLRDISVLTRMDEASNMMEMEKVDITYIVTNIIKEVSLELEERHITVMNSLKSQIVLKGNYSLLYSIFRNLMDNAIAYAGTDIQIHICCFREDENFYYFSFSDTGVGVAPEHLNRLFERFYRVDKGRSRKLGGTGLGLAIVKNAVIIHGGSISAKNNPSGGLEFLFTLAKEKGN
ncbi:MAG: ATP-binding protein [Bacteroides sp.]|jgi:two-component system OmpR family sensor kinase/two-component system phosphate regulon sensor histidine kinase PhoR|nr:ATP-binding protein [Bacteroides sp.]